MRPIIKPKLNQCKRFVFFAALPYPLLTAANSKAFTKSARPPQQPLRFVPHKFKDSLNSAISDLIKELEVQIKNKEAEISEMERAVEKIKKVI